VQYCRHAAADRQTDRQTDRHTDTQTRVTTIHFSWSSTHAKCNELLLCTESLTARQTSHTPMVWLSYISLAAVPRRTPKRVDVILNEPTSLFSETPTRNKYRTSFISFKSPRCGRASDQSLIARSIDPSIDIDIDPSIHRSVLSSIHSKPSSPDPLSPTTITSLVSNAKPQRIRARYARKLFYRTLNVRCICRLI